MKDPDYLYTIKEVAAKLRVHPDTVRLWIKKGIFDPVRVGGTVRIPKSTLDALIEHKHGLNVAR